MPEPDRFVRLPRAELHVHLDGSLRPDTLLDLARAAGAALPTADPEALRRHMRVEDARNLDDYLARFALTVQVLQTPGSLVRVAEEMVLDASADGVHYLEVRYCPWLSCAGGLTLDEVIEAAWRGLQRGTGATGVPARLIVCTLRHLPPALSEAMAEAAVRHRDRGVAGFDIAGSEAHHPAAPHAHAFEIAVRGGLGITVHAGEAAGPASIAEAVEVCHAGRLGHGTRLVEDPALLALVRDRRIPVEINLTSNVQTRAVPSLGAHPLRRYLDEGLVVTLCTDNWLMSDVTLSGEYARAAGALAVTDAECRTLARAGFEAAFLPGPERRALQARVEPGIRSWS